MFDEETMIRKEIYTDQLNDLYAELTEYMNSHPQCRILKELDSQRKIIAIAHSDSRYFTDEEHFAQWDKLMSHAGTMMSLAYIRSSIDTNTPSRNPADPKNSPLFSWSRVKPVSSLVVRGISIPTSVITRVSTTKRPTSPAPRQDRI